MPAVCCLEAGSLMLQHKRKPMGAKSQSLLLNEVTFSICWNQHVEKAEQCAARSAVDCLLSMIGTIQCFPVSHVSLTLSEPVTRSAGGWEKCFLVQPLFS